MLSGLQVVCYRTPSVSEWVFFLHWLGTGFGSRSQMTRWPIMKSLPRLRLRMATIYLSSTYLDLHKSREAVYRALRTMQCDVIAMEDHVANGARQEARPAAIARMESQDGVAAATFSD